MADLGSLKKLKAQTVWPGEATSFTPWLAANLGKLGAVLGLELEPLQTEAPAGTFSLDILARDLAGQRHVVIENQFGSTNHDHLGKILTYAAGYDAATIVWIAEDFREEHRQALDWLNQHTGTEVNFFGVVLELLQIDDSLPACHFKLVAFPNQWTKNRVARTPVSAKGEAYRAFFQPLIDLARTKHHFAGMRTALAQNWISFSASFPGAAYNVSFTYDRVRVELYMDAGEAIYPKLLQDKAAIEDELGEELSWEPLEERLASRIAVYREAKVTDDPASLDSVRGWALDQLVRFRNVFGSRLRNLK